jgi:hypothetical protein
MRLFFSLLLLLLPLQAAQGEALEYLNRLRTGAGMQPLAYDAALSKAAKAHAAYALRAQSYSHSEKRSLRGYTGTTPAQRAVHAGYPSRFVIENIAVNTTTPKETIDNLLSAIYHRFAFLSFDIDEMGEGRRVSRKKRRIQQTDVFDMGADGLAALCRENFRMHNGMYYLTGLCAREEKKIPQKRYLETRDLIRKRNSAIVLYPYDSQQDVPPAFYNESPDPMPGYKVSGFPVSVQFNPFYFTKTKILSFRLYEASTGKLLKTRLIDRQSDPNHRLGVNEYALMPLKRLEYGSTYRVELRALADGREVSKQWHFRTRGFAERLFRITGGNTRIDVKGAKRIILYFPPQHKKDILKRVRHTEGLKVRFIDANTLAVEIPDQRPHGGFRVVSGRREVRF